MSQTTTTQAPQRTAVRHPGSGRQMRAASAIIQRDEGTDAQAEMLTFFRMEGEPQPAAPTTKRADASRAREAHGSVTLGNVTSGDAWTILDPWFVPKKVAKLPSTNNILGQCIAAMVTNIESFGHQLEYIGEKGQEEAPAAIAEKEELSELLDQPNGEYDMAELRSRIRNDLEHTGNGYMEVVEADDIPELLYHVDALTMQLTTLDEEEVEIEQSIKRGGKEIRKKVKRKFRRFVQTVNGVKTYFKEFGDPRTIDPKTGKVNENLPSAEAATAIYHFKITDIQGVYGAPRWIAQLPAILGSRESELTNLQFFKDNAIPAMVLLVSGGLLTSTSSQDIYKHFNSARGRAAQNRLLVIEATGDEAAASDNGNIPPPRIEMKPLGAERQNDALFQDYDEANRKKIRSSFRLPPLFIGLSEDHTFASANASLAFAESQVFGPERAKIDRAIELVLRARLQRLPKFWRYKANAPSLADPTALISAVSTFTQAGAISPNAAISIANEMFDLRMPLIDEAWANRPFELTKIFATGTLALPAGELDTAPPEPALKSRADVANELQAEVDAKAAEAEERLKARDPGVNAAAQARGEIVIRQRVRANA